MGAWINTSAYIGEVDVEVEVELDEFSTEDIIEELKERDAWPVSEKEEIITLANRILVSKQPVSEDVYQLLLLITGR